MKKLLFLPIFFFLFRTQAVEVDTTLGTGAGSFNTTAPTSTDITNWNTGSWGANGVTGWNYVGSVNGASGVYLGNGWVLTAGHVGAGTFTLSGTSYSEVAGSAQGIGTADLTLFRLTLAPNLPSLTIATSAPTALSPSKDGSSVVMIGYGGGTGETWGLNTVTRTNIPVTVQSYTTTDFETAYGITTAGNRSATNYAELILGDSGGGGFIYDSSSSAWTLAGINEAHVQSLLYPNDYDSYMVQLSSYSSQINSIIAVPEPSEFALLGLGIVALHCYKRL